MHLNCITSLTFAAGIATVNALPLDALFSRAPSCSANSVGCQGTSDSCCIPTNGLMVLALQWLPGWCAMNACSDGVVASIPSGAWTIHGLWPNQCSGSQTGANGCDATRQYASVSAAVSTMALYSDLVKYWISYKGTDMASYDSFWVHEWGKHGTCYSPADSKCVGATGAADLEKYFGDALKTRNTYDLYAPLYNAGVIPNGNSYDKTQFKNAILAAFPGTNIGLACTGSYVNEVRLSLVAVGGGLVGAPSLIAPETDNCPQKIVYAAPPGGIIPQPSPVKSSTTTTTKTTSSTSSAATTTKVATTTTVQSDLKQCAPLLCSPGNKRNNLAAPCNTCVSAIGAVDSHCTQVGWNKKCVSEVTTICGIAC
ncbi:ribonuclease T2-like protein [Obelidium mucronatum]|nr:ribonuclease T2-like protein [Obelidium mucronatum]